MNINIRRGISRRTLGHLREHPNERYTAEQIATATGDDPKRVSAVLTAKYADGRVLLQREQIVGAAGGLAYRYWIADAGEFAGADPRAYAVARWLLRRGIAARPSVIAKATGVEPRTVARLLEHWAEKGAAVRCELTLRSGIDRFEYRMAASSGRHFGRTIRPARAEALA